VKSPGGAAFQAAVGALWALSSGSVAVLQHISWILTQSVHQRMQRGLEFFVVTQLATR
jgi:hypothetical protein